VHGVEVSPFATPNETMLLEDLHDVERQAILVAGALWSPIASSRRISYLTIRARMHKAEYAGRVGKNAVPLQDGLEWGRDD
jgi:hypothetical protein